MAPPSRPPPSSAPSAGPSRRPPSKLRVSTSSRKASNPSLSLVYASPGSSLPPIPAFSSSSSSTSRSEEALSRQLDGDLGGKQMGLRSRRSSSATVRTVNTLNGNGGPQSPRESIAEEDEGGGPILEREMEVERRQTRLNPKTSSSWLRWNSPTPSFPRSVKGKEREGEATPVRRGSNVGGASIRRQASRRSEFPNEEVVSSETDQSAAATQQSAPTVDPPPEPPELSEVGVTQAGPPTVPPPPTPTPKGRGWFSRNPPPPAETNRPAAEPSPDATGTDAVVAEDNTAAPPPPPENQSSSVGPAVLELTAPPADTAQKRWAGYLSWGRGKVPPPVLAQESSKSDVTDQALPLVAAPEALDESPSVAQGGKAGETFQNSRSDLPDQPPTVETQSAGAKSTTPPQTAAEPQVAAEQSMATPLTDTTSEPIPSAPASKQTWGTFFYNIVIPQTREPSSMDSAQPRSDEQVVKPTSPTDEQRPIHVDPAPMPEPAQVEGQATAQQPPEQAQVSSIETKEPEPASSKPRKDSQASTTGWLSYLAFRASQKKIEQPASVNTAGTGEEVMDLSNDPNFPAGPSEGEGTSGKAAPVKAAVKESGGAMKPPSTIPMRDKRPSNSSLRSAASVTPIPPSPRKPGHQETGTTTPVPSIKAGPSSLPPPPQRASQQPNLVIPTFSSTFDRPPRCFLPPLPDKPPASSPPSQGGLAWRALGAVGSYVYSGSAHEPKKEELVEGDPKETRGRKEGRKVGADLPRRLGLQNGHADDGWKTVKRVVVVGVHGWFPAKMLNSVIGEPTGTSSKFANMMGQAVKRFFDDKGVDDIRLTMIPLEGEGTIEHRVDRLYKSYLSNPAWINDLRRADAIFFAAHSQGCIVTTHLLSRLIAQGHVKTPLNAEAVARCSWAFGPVSIVPPSEPRTPRSRKADTVPVNVEEGGYQKVCMLAMCGVHQGPLYSLGTSTVIQPYLQWFENAAARELFEFQDTTSAVAQAYQRALAMVLENDVRVVLLSSLNDQVVPIYGSSFSAATHPLLLRALFVDGASYTASDFMTNLLCFAFMLRNAGISDEHLIEHLSEATAGSLTGLGHSTPYEEPATFRLAVEYLFHAGPASEPMTELKVDRFAAREGRNDFELPWIMRAIVDSPEVKDLFPGELRDLKEGILHWKPTTKALRDIKKRLEPMAGRQSKLRPLPQSPSTTSLNTAAELGASPSSNKHLAPPAGLRQVW